MLAERGLSRIKYSPEATAAFDTDSDNSSFSASDNDSSLEDTLMQEDASLSDIKSQVDEFVNSQVFTVGSVLNQELYERFCSLQRSINSFSAKRDHESLQRSEEASRDQERAKKKFELIEQHLTKLRNELSNRIEQTDESHPEFELHHHEHQQAIEELEAAWDLLQELRGRHLTEPRSEPLQIVLTLERENLELRTTIEELKRENENLRQRLKSAGLL